MNTPLVPFLEVKMLWQHLQSCKQTLIFPSPCLFSLARIHKDLHVITKLCWRKSCAVFCWVQLEVSFLCLGCRRVWNLQSTDGVEMGGACNHMIQLNSRNARSHCGLKHHLFVGPGTSFRGLFTGDQNEWFGSWFSRDTQEKPQIDQQKNPQTSLSFAPEP